jgi:hypothetical protein
MINSCKNLNFFPCVWYSIFVVFFIVMDVFFRDFFLSFCCCYLCESVGSFVLVYFFTLWVVLCSYFEEAKHAVELTAVAARRSHALENMMHMHQASSASVASAASASAGTTAEVKLRVDCYECIRMNFYASMNIHAKLMKVLAVSSGLSKLPFHPMLKAICAVGNKSLCFCVDPLYCSRLVFLRSVFS